MLGFATTIALSVGAAVLPELVGPVVASAEQLQNIAELALLASLPAIR